MWLRLQIKRVRREQEGATRRISVTREKTNIDLSSASARRLNHQLKDCCCDAVHGKPESHKIKLMLQRLCSVEDVPLNSTEEFLSMQLPRLCTSLNSENILNGPEVQTASTLIKPSCDRDFVLSAAN